MTKILILGGTTEARELAAQLADRPVILSLAGRTANPAAQPVPVRTGGFGGADGLATYLTTEGIGLLIDATHPYANQISGNAVIATQKAGVPLLSLHRPGWEKVGGDLWVDSPDTEAAVRSLGDAQQTIFVALGRQEVGPLRLAPQHRYIVRSVDAIDPPLDLPDVTYLLARGPFPESDERALLTQHKVTAILCKNSGGDATYGKILAARALGIPVHMVARPYKPAGMLVTSVAAALAHPMLRGE
jgi:precorrin-6A/cobalt-precorrin-6A reductase